MDEELLLLIGITFENKTLDFSLKNIDLNDKTNSSSYKEALQNMSLDELRNFTEGFTFSRKVLNTFNPNKFINNKPTTLREEVGILMTQVSDLKNHIDNLNETISQLQRENAILKAENEQLKAENAELKAENEQLKAENAELKAEILSLKSELNKALLIINQCQCQNHKPINNT